MNKNHETELKKIFDASLQQFELDHTGAYPYEDYKRLYSQVALHKPLRVLEAGTGYGLTSIAMALAFHDAQIDTLDKNASVIKIARNFAQDANVSNQITFNNTNFSDFLKQTSDQAYDMVFFDGFAPGLIVFLELERVLRSGGIIVCANLKLRGDKRKIVKRLSDKYFYNSYSLNEDTGIGYKL